jgi:hypothetical protein
MNKSAPISPVAIFLTLVAAGLFMCGCAARPKQPEPFLDSKEHHVENGFKLIRKERLQAAQREFELALGLDPRSSAAYRGVALIYGMKRDFETAYAFMNFAVDHAMKKEDSASAQVGFLRLHTLERGPGWLNAAEGRFRQAISIAGDMPDTYYQMGLAYKYGYRFEKSEEAFEAVIDLHKALVVEAAEQLLIIDKIKRAGPESELGKRVAVLDWVTRADAAGLFIRELRLDRMYGKTHPVRKDIPIPPDVKEHLLKEEIIGVLKKDIRGLKCLPDGTFDPNMFVTRADYAVMLADIIVKVRDDPALVSRYAGSPSPYEDVPEYVSYFNAILICDKWGPIIETNDALFNPMSRISAADAVLSIRKLREKLQGP